MLSYFKSKPKEREYSGFMGDTSEEQDKVLAEFKEWVTVSELGDMKAMHFDDYDLLRFCRARKFDLPAMQIMWQNFINWRKEQGVEDIIETYKYDEYDKVIEVYPHGYHNIDKLGRPIYIERFGLMDIEKLWTVTTRERIVRHYTQEYELMMKVRFPVCSELAGKKIQQGLTIFDMTGGGVTTANPSTKELFKLAAQVGSDYYPETMGNTFIINAPMVFRGLWKVAKGFLDERTRNKIKVKGGEKDYLPVLLEFVEEENLPTFLGGKNTDQFPANHGPWKNYEIKDNVLVKKSDQEEEKKEESQPEPIEGEEAKEQPSVQNKQPVEGGPATQQEEGTEPIQQQMEELKLEEKQEEQEEEKKE